MHEYNSNCSSSFQASSMLQSSQVSACWTWAQISLKTPSWSLETQQAGVRSGTSVTLHWTSHKRWGCVCTMIYVVYVYTESQCKWGILFLHSRFVSDRLCCSVGRLMGERWWVWRSSRWSTLCSSSRPQLTALLDYGRKTEIMWVISGRKCCGTLKNQPLTRGEVHELISVALEHMSNNRKHKTNKGNHRVYKRGCLTKLV